MEDNEEEEDNDNYHMFTADGDSTMGGDEDEEEPIFDEPIFDDPDDDLGRAILDAKISCGSEKERLKLEKMLEDHNKLLYPNCEDGQKKLGTMLELLQWKAENGTSDSQKYHSLPSIAAIPAWYPAFSGHLHNLGTTVCCDPLTFSPTSTSPFHFRSLSSHQEWPDPNRHRGHQKSAHQKWALLQLRLPPFYYHRLQ